MLFYHLVTVKPNSRRRFAIVCVLLAVGSLNLSDIVLSQRDGLGTRLGLPNTFLDWHWLAFDALPIGTLGSALGGPMLGRFARGLLGALLR
mgnify:CR=1 FL=1